MSGKLRLDNISVGYGEREIIRNIDLEFEPGKFCALLGPNGSGKTTLLKAMCGLIPVKSGNCLIDGRDCARFHERKRAQYISYIPQRHSKMMGMTVLDVVLMGLNPRLPMLGSPTSGNRNLAREMIDGMGLGEYSEKDFSHLSEGQKQMIILTRSLLQNTPVMLMDEPDSALDFHNRHSVLAEIREVIHREDKVGIITLHDPNFALAYCDRLILLKNGGIAGQLDIAGVTKMEIEQKLSIIYGDIAVLEDNGNFMMRIK